MKHTKYPTLKAWRKAQDWSQERAARELGLAYRTYVRYENGERYLSGEKLRDLIAKTHVAVESLAGAV